MTENRTTPKSRPRQAESAGAVDRSRDTARRTVEGFEANPLGILVGGLAVGVLAGALLPRSAREKELLAPVGRRIGDTARAALDSAKATGLSELEARGITRDAARDQVKSLLEGVGKAAATAGTAAVGTVRGKGDND